MTNEELAILAQNENNSELIPVLWSKVERLLYMLIGRHYYKNVELFKSCDIELSDLRQECYFVFLNVLKKFDIDNGYKFTTYFDYEIRNAVMKLLHYRGRKELLDNALSIDKPQSISDDEAYTLLDILPSKDKVEEEVIHLINKGDEQEAVRYAVSQLPLEYRQVIEEYYFNNRILSDIAKEKGLTMQGVARIKDKALSILRRSNALKNLYYANEKHKNWTEFNKHKIEEWKPHNFEIVEKYKENIHNERKYNLNR